MKSNASYACICFDSNSKKCSLHDCMIRNAIVQKFMVKYKIWRKKWKQERGENTKNWVVRPWPTSLEGLHLYNLIIQLYQMEMLNTYKEKYVKANMENILYYG